MVCNHRVSSPYECRGVVRSKSLKVTRSSLTTCYASMCDNSRCNTYNLSKGLLIKYRRLVKCRWCLTSTPWTPPTPSSSLTIYAIKMAVKYNAATRRHKHSPETLIIHKISAYISSPCIYKQCKAIISFF